MFEDDAISMPTEVVRAELHIPSLAPADDVAVELRSALSTLLAKIQANIGRIGRYGVTSLICLAISEATLLVLVDLKLNAGLAAIAANLAGTVPSYLLSRYWIWQEADRQRVGRQVLLYWTTSLAAILVTSVATDLVARHAPTGMLHLPYVGAGYFLISVALWVSKFVLYQKVIFPGTTLEEPATTS